MHLHMCEQAIEKTGKHWSSSVQNQKTKLYYKNESFATFVNKIHFKH